ncbi:hypothetical protein [Streptomyces hydrogenans]|uniref:hypothetical protein n=1 Tax=Streptomyces hydrogenans TaxID=1873719 RepID=UPI003680B7EF
MTTEKKGPILGCAIPIGLVVAAAGIALLMFGWDLFTSEAEAVCGSSVMQDDDVCVSGSGEHAVRRNAEEMQSGEGLAQKIFGGIGILAGGVISVGGVALLITVIKHRND